ncbi:LON peptidase substrate-binding domain-containing protein [Amycolatopsis nigrescens]|uniref:LON peptidase substrate-binding domain-containing protein n=1 Tax=Amycolatopsis nigrescens TaxID=381445 RepID=UPI00036CEAEF|nr:LON peptidase substrate-binding domain-containing protein [Amycolatopsis nigrescens]
MTGTAESGATRTTVPLFPLQTVLLPGANLPLHLFEPRYRQLAVDLVTGTVANRQFGIVAIKTSLVREVEGLEHVHPVGCSALLREAQRLPDGRFDIITTGKHRFRLLDVDTTSAPYLMGTVEWLPDEPLPPGCDEAAELLGDVARAAHRRYCESAWERADWDAPPPETSVADLAHLLAADCLLTLDDRQLLLEETHPLRRLRIVCRLLNREAGFLGALRAVPVPHSELDDARPPNLN